MIELIKITKNNQIINAKINHHYDDGSLAIQYVEYDSNGKHLGHRFLVIKPTKYAVVHHSEMTNIDVFFISEDEQTLLDNTKNFDKYIWNEDNDFNKIMAELNRNNIEFKNNEVSDIEDNILIVDYQSYRF